MGLTRITSDGITDGTITGTDLATNIDLVDNQFLRIGNSQDLQIHHDGSNSFIKDTGTGVLAICSNEIQINNAANTHLMIRAIQSGAAELYHNNSKKFETTSGGCTVTGDLLITDDLTLQDNLLMGDTDKIAMGDSSDLEIYHDGSHSYIDNTGTGNLYIKDAGIVRVRTASFGVDNADGSEALISATANGAVELYNDNTKRFETDSSGATVTGRLATGTLTTGGASTFGGSLIFDTNFAYDIGQGGTRVRHIYQEGNHDFADNAEIRMGNLDDFKIFHNGISNILQSSNGNIELTAGSEYMVKAIPNGAVELYHDNSKKFETTSSGGTLYGDWLADASFLLADNDKIKLGNGADLQIYHDGTNSHIKDSGTGGLLVNSSGFDVLNAADNEFMARFIQDGAVELYHNNNKKFETLSDGVNVTGTLKVNGSALAGGKVIQQVSVVKTDTASNSTGSQQTWEFNDSSLRVQITGSSTSNKFLFLGQVTIGGEISTHVGMRDGESNSNVTGMMATGTGNRRASTSGKTGSDSHAANTVPIVGLISVPDTNQHTYYFQFSHTSGGSQTIYINTGSNTGDNAERGRYISSLTVMEIAA